MTRFLGAVLVLCWAAGAAAQTATEAVMTALRSANAAIAAGRFQSAVDLLKPAYELAEEVPAADRNSALAAVNFYTAVALNGLKDDAGARAHLKEFFRISPGAKSIDPSKFDARFVALFRELAGSGPAANETFEAQYPNTAPAAVNAADLDEVAVQFLGSQAEKLEWASAGANRDKFLADFWAKRDSNPATPENEFRDAFAKRVAIADSAFRTRDERGALSDRGRVFVLLGKPAVVRRRAMRPEDVPRRPNVQAPDQIPRGTVEQWIYTSDQIAIRLPKPSLAYRFITEDSVGVAVLQKDDPFEVQALEAAARGKQ